MRALRLMLLSLAALCVFAWGFLWLMRRAADEPDVRARILESLESETSNVETLVMQFPGAVRGMVPDIWNDYIAARLEGREADSHFQRALDLSRAMEKCFEDSSLLDATRRYQNLTESEVREKSRADKWIGEVELDYREGRHDRARKLANEALDVYRHLGDSWGELRALNVLGNIAWVVGEMEKAESIYQMLSEKARGWGNWEREAAARNNLARMEEARGNLREAAAAYRSVWTLGEKHGIPRITGFALLYQGSLYHRLGLHERAVDCFGRAGEIFEKQNDPRMEAVAASNRGASLHRLEEREEAVAAYERSLELRTSERERAPTLLHVAELHFQEGDSARALEALEKILALTAGTDEVESKRLRWGALVTAFDIHRDGGREDLAQQFLEEAEAVVEEIGLSLDRVETSRRRARVSLDHEQIGRAVEELETAIGIIETLRTSPEAEEERIRFLAAQESVYEDLAEIHLREQGQPLEAFLINEQSRSRAFLDSLHGGVRLSSDEQGALRVVLASSAEPESIQRVMSSIPVDGALLHYTVAPRWLSVLSFDRNGLRSWHVIDIDERELVRITRRFARAARENMAQEFHTAGIQLAQWLLEPVKEVLEDHQTLIIVPDDVLFEMPWAALQREGRYLVEEHRLVIEPSASVFVRLTERDERARAASALLVANPALGQVSYSADRAAQGMARPLPEAEAEAREIAALITRAKILDGEDANESSVRSLMGRYDVVHFGTHAWIVADQPLSSSLLLAGGVDSVEGARLDPVSPSDGVLTGYEALGIELKPGAMVTLAACESIGRGARRGEGVVGLARGFFEAGAGTVVGSLWPVEDRATRQLMVRFYREIADGKRSTAEALSRAQAAVARGEAGERRREPYYWAGFILIGDGR